MKVKLPNGIEIEADKVDVHPDGTVTLSDFKTEGTREDEYAVSNAVNNLTDVQRRTYRLLEKMGEAHATGIAEELEITTGAAVQRLSNLVNDGLAERTQRGHYRALK